MEYNDTTYRALVEDLFSKHPSVQSAGFKVGAYKPGLEGMTAFDRSLGSPWKRFRTIHVAGTNGKGSVSSMLAAALSASGLKVGLYTSPHLVDFRERIKIIGPGTSQMSMITKEAVWDFLTQKDLTGLSFFEITTGMAFWWFADQNVDAAVIEVGLGGRLDSTNIITPEISIVTSIGLDHCAMLGDTRAAIAAEKAGIFKPGVPALVATTDDETAPVFERIASEVHCPLFFADSSDFTSCRTHPCENFAALIPPSRSWAPPVYEATGGHGFQGVGSAALNEIKLDLEGPCQSINLRTVLAALELMGVDPDMEAISRTAAITGFHGRWESLMDNPEVICDIGHNPAALELNFKRLAGLGRPLVIVYGIMADKDLDGIAPLMPAGAHYILAAPSTERSLKVEALFERLGSLRPDLETESAPSVADAVRRALELASGIPGSLVYIGGSTFVVSEAVTSLHIDI